MYYFNAIEQLEEFKSYILSNLDNDISFGNMEYYYSLSKISFLSFANCLLQKLKLNYGRQN